MGSYAKIAKMGTKFKLYESPLGTYHLVHMHGEVYEVYCNDHYTGMAAYFTFKHLIIETVYEGIRFEKNIKLSELIFIP